MPIFKGHTTGSILSQQFNIGSRITSINLVDTSASPNNVIVAVVEDGEQVFIRRMAIAADESYNETTNIQLLAGWEILIISSGALDYYITTE